MPLRVRRERLPAVEPERLRAVVLFVLVAAGYVLGYELARSWFSPEGQGASFFPSAGVTLAALLLVTRRRWPIVLAAAGLAELSLDLYYGIPLDGTITLTIANLVQPLVGALLVTALVGRPDLSRTRDLTAFLGGAVVVAPIVGGLLGAAAFVQLGGSGWPRFALEWWSGDGLGVLVVGGAILSLRSSAPPPGTRRLAGGLVLAALAVASVTVVFRLERLAWVYLPIALLVVIAFRIGTRGVALTSAVMAFVAAETTSRGYDLWEALNVPPADAVLYLQLAIAVVISVALALAAEITQRERAAFVLAQTEEAMRAAAERAALYDSEREARVRAELLERHAAHLAVAATTAEVAASTVRDLEEAGIPVVGVERVLGRAIRILADTGGNGSETFTEYPDEALTPGADAIRTGRVVEVPTRAEYASRYPGRAGRPAQHLPGSVYTVPLRSAGGLVLGALSAEAPDPHWFDDARRQLVTAIAEQTGLALERASLLEREREARRHAEVEQDIAARLQQISAALAAAETARDVASVVETQLVGALGGKSGSLYELDEEAGMLRPLDHDSYLDDAIRDRREIAVDAELPQAESVRRATPILLGDPAALRSAYPAAQPAVDDPASGRAWAHAPLIAGSRPIGLLTVSYDAPQAFDERQRGVMLSASDAVAQALQRAKLFEAEQAARRRADDHAILLGRLSSAVGRLAGATTEREIAELLIEDAIRTLGSSRGVVALARQDGTELVIVATRGYPDEVVSAYPKISGDLTSALPDAFRSGEAVWIESPAGYAARYPEMAAEYARLGYEAGAFIPLRGRSEPIGALGVHFSSVRSFTQDEKEWVAAFARQGGLALQRAASFEREQDARWRAEQLESSSSAFAVAGSTAEVGETAVAHLEQWGASQSAFHVLDGDRVRFLTGRGTNDEARARSGTLPLSVSLPVTDAIRTGAPVVVSTGVEVDARYPDLAVERRNGAWETAVALPLRTTGGRVNGAIVATAEASNWLDDQRRGLLSALADQAGVALERGQLRAESDALAEDAALLAVLGESLDRAQPTSERAHALVNTLALRRSLFAAIHLLEESGLPRLAARASPPGADCSGLDELAVTAMVKRVVATGRLAVDDADGLELVAVPIRASARMLGVLTVATPREAGGRLTAELLLRVAARSALALGNSLLYEHEREVSHSLQTGLLGPELTAAPSAAIATAYRPGTAMLEVGGDWYDAFSLPDGRLALVVGDVVGHGLEAAIAMGQLRGAVRALGPVGSPREVVERLDAFVETLPEAAMTTVAYAVLAPDEGDIVYACAGHPPPLLVSADGTSRLLWDGRSTPLGSSFEASRVEAKAHLEAGDTIVLYTDGLIERREDGVSAGLDALLEISGRPAAGEPGELVERILDALLGDDPQDDDACVLAVRRVVRREHFAHSFPARPPEIGRLRSLLAVWLAEVDVEPQRREDAVLAVSEAAANSVEHAYDFDGSGTISVAARIADGKVCLSIGDEGTWRDPPEETDRGRGFRIMNALMDDVTVDCGPTGTVIRMSLPTRAEVSA